ncbi:D-threo-aldose 1-dehydrogenase [Microbacterium phyllosphaerae]|nr:D-threo-aldose 1-dehydrogenase [Microbacterium phyllosphaerae]
MAEIYGYDVGAERAERTVEAVLDSGIGFIDTSNAYGNGESERRIGSVIRRRGLPKDFVLATKADADPETGDFSARRVLASFFESRERLGVDRFPIFYLHDPEFHPVEEIFGPGGALDGMRELKASGAVDVVGVAGGDIEVMKRCLDSGLFEVVLSHNRYTLLDQTAEPLIEYARSTGASFINAAPYASGMLAKDAAERPRYAYRTPSDAVVAAVERLRELCRQFDVPLPAVALQFSLREPRITSTVVGVSHPDRVDALMRNTAIEIPEELWTELQMLQLTHGRG